MTETTEDIELRIYGRFSFLHLHQPKIGKNDKGQETANFCGHVLFKESDNPGFTLPKPIVYGAGAIQAVKDAQRLAAQRAWPKNWEAMLRQLQHTDKLALHDGIAKAAKYPEYDGHYYVSANGKKRPTLMRTVGNENVPVVETDNLFYGGAWGVLIVAVYAQGADGRKSDYGERINVQLKGAHWVKHDSQFGGGGGRVAAPDEFVPIIAGEADAPAPAAAGGGRSLL